MEKTIDMRFMKKMLTLIIAMGAIFGIQARCHLL